MPNVEYAQVHRPPLEGDHISHPHECPSCQEPYDCSGEDCGAHYEIYCVKCYDVALAACEAPTEDDA
jgi:hypothetical protein